MIYVTDSPITLVNHHIQATLGKRPTLIRDAKEADVSLAISTGGTLEDMDQLPEAIFLIDYKLDSVPDVSQHVEFNTTYICVPEISKKWEHLQIIKINPSIYKGSIEAVRAIFNDDAFDYFWNTLCLKRFKSNPSKWNMELNSLLIWYHHNKKRISLEFLKEKYSTSSNVSLNTFLLCMGEKKAYSVIRELTNSELWTLLVGSDDKAPFIYHYLVEKNNASVIYYYVSLIREAVIEGLIDLRLAAVLLNGWLIRLGLVRNYRLIEVKNNKESNRFRELVYG